MPATQEKSASEKAKLYKAVKALLAQRPMMIEELAAELPFPIARITQACQTMRAVGDAHIGSYAVGNKGVRKRCFHAGPGEDVPPLYKDARRKRNPPLAGKVLAVLEDTVPKQGSMTVQDVMKKVFYTRPAIQHALQLLCAAGKAKICGRITQPGGTTLLYAPACSV